ncbi:family 16 glycosylhydrolase [Tenacibaculum tangerinum]|uniref:Family 16 glycosylhydrolase n=1 Tax=Tenacibaculum tangerinum TaxID=3038772 RepID=A0ABY8L3U1_9FLAO|nr:family 16 glycosylhydrolase [Tenacibaculum tangerinum]WGH76045.1 family 16 glycosylhydrolase [Tenacibaculum tangerinum]
MKNIKNKITLTILALSLVFLFNQCQSNDYEFGEIIAPTNVNVQVGIVGQDDANPYGDGSGVVMFSVSAENALSYTINFGDGGKESLPSGSVSHVYSKTGVHKYTAVVRAIGAAGVESSKTVEVEVFSSFSDDEALDFLAGTIAGDSKKWYWQANKDLHVGLGPVTDDYGNGEFAYEAWWNNIKAWDEEKSCMYDNEFVFTRTEDGITFEQTQGPAFIPGTYAGVLGVAGDQCHDESVATTMFGVKDVSFGPSTSKAATEGSYNDNPYRGTSFEISDGGFMGWYVGTSKYDIISVTNDELIVRIIEKGGGFAWYHKFTSSKPVKGPNYTYNDLVWEDDFNTDGAPNAANWTYDLGAGGWGNNEAQTYTDNAENVKVEGGNLIITAKADGSGGYTSARIKSEGLYEFTYGRVEVRAKLPEAQGTWPAIWMLGANFSTVGWPNCGEIDIMEQKGDDKNTVLATSHWYDTTNNIKADYGKTTTITNASSEFHLYTLEWTEESVKMYLDDELYYELDNNADLPFNQDFFLILNVAMGGTLGGTIDAGFTEATMEIDYVKVYQ